MTDNSTGTKAMKASLSTAVVFLLLSLQSSHVSSYRAFQPRALTTSPYSPLPTSCYNENHRASNIQESLHQKRLYSSTEDSKSDSEKEVLITSPITDAKEEDSVIIEAPVAQKPRKAKKTEDDKSLDVSTGAGGALVGLLLGAVLDSSADQSSSIDLSQTDIPLFVPPLIAEIALAGVVGGAAYYATQQKANQKVADLAREIVGKPTKSFGDAIAAAVSAKVNEIVDDIKSIPGNLQKAVLVAVDGVKAAAKRKADNIVAEIKAIPENTQKAAVSTLESTKQSTNKKIQSTIADLKALPGNIASAVEAKARKTADSLASLPGKLADRAQRSIESKAAEVKNTVDSKVAEISKIIPSSAISSPPKSVSFTAPSSSSSPSDSKLPTAVTKTALTKPDPSASTTTPGKPSPLTASKPSPPAPQALSLGALSGIKLPSFPNPPSTSQPEASSASDSKPKPTAPSKATAVPMKSAASTSPPPPSPPSPPAAAVISKDKGPSLNSFFGAGKGIDFSSLESKKPPLTAAPAQKSAVPASPVLPPVKTPSPTSESVKASIDRDENRSNNPFASFLSGQKPAPAATSAKPAVPPSTKPAASSPNSVRGAPLTKRLTFNPSVTVDAIAASSTAAKKTAPVVSPPKPSATTPSTPSTSRFSLFSGGNNKPEAIGAEKLEPAPAVKTPSAAVPSAFSLFSGGMNSNKAASSSSAATETKRPDPEPSPAAAKASTAKFPGFSLFSENKNKANAAVEPKTPAQIPAASKPKATSATTASTPTIQTNQKSNSPFQKTKSSEPKQPAQTAAVKPAKTSPPSSSSVKTLSQFALNSLRVATSDNSSAISEVDEALGKYLAGQLAAEGFYRQLVKSLGGSKDIAYSILPEMIGSLPRGERKSALNDYYQQFAN